MSLSFLLRGRFRPLTVILSLMLGSLSFVSSARAQLLFEQHQGGRFQYNGTGNFFTALIDVVEPIQVHGISGWIQGGTGTAMISITGPNTFDLYHAPLELSLTPLPPPGELSYPAMWQGVSNLKWDLVPGTYQLEFEGVAMPYTFGYLGPVADVPAPHDFARFHNDEYLEQLAFGVRIYGAPLSAIPEPAVYGWSAVLLLGSLTAWRARHRSSSSQPL